MPAHPVTGSTPSALSHPWPALARPLRHLALALVAGLLLVAGAQAQGQGQLNMYNWSNYISELTVPNFEKESGVKMRYDTFDSNEILHAKLVAGRSGYDIVVPSSNWGALQARGGLLTKIDKSKIC